MPFIARYGFVSHVIWIVTIQEMHSSDTLTS